MQQLIPRTGRPDLAADKLFSVTKLPDLDPDSESTMPNRVAYLFSTSWRASLCRLPALRTEPTNFPYCIIDPKLGNF